MDPIALAKVTMTKSPFEGTADKPLDRASKVVKLMQVVYTHKTMTE